MAKIEICPICGGVGKVYSLGKSANSTDDLGYEWRVCHGCGGKGWVEVSENE